MSTLGTMATAVSGLEAHGQNLSIISDNIVNANTTGFKSSRGEFKSVLADTMSSRGIGNEIGRGTRVGGVTGLFTQGSIQRTQRGTDLAVNGNGFFMLNSASKGQVFTRDGSFRFDKEGWLTDLGGARVQAYQATPDGSIAGRITDLRIPYDTIPAKATSSLEIHANLDARAIPDDRFDLERPDETAHFTSATQVFDSVGNSHAVALYFSKVDEGTWQWYGMVDGADVAGGEPGEKSILAQGVLEFDEIGQLHNSEQELVNTTFAGGALPDQDIFFNFGDEIDEDGSGQRGTTQYGSKHSIFRNLQDGFSAGQLLDTAIDDNGVVKGVYSNGVDRVLGQLALARFEATERLARAGDNHFKASMASGTANLGRANDNGIGAVLNRSLEQSNVDLAREFVDMIKAQRGFQASAKTITTADEMLSEIMTVIK